MTSEQRKALQEIGKWLGAILVGLLAGGGGAIATTRAQAASDSLEPRVTHLEYRLSEQETTLDDVVEILRKVASDVSEMRGELKHFEPRR